MKQSLIAPCGMNCNVCIAYLREKNKCNGCRTTNIGYNRRCIIKNCKILKKNNWKYCNDKCKKFPCQRLKSLDKRYRTKYDFSMIKNLKIIKEKGIKNFIKNQEKKYQRKSGIFCIHKKKVIKI